MAAEGPPVGILRVLAGATGSTTQWTTNGLPTTATDHIGSDGGACTESTVAQSRRPSRGTNQRRGDLDRVKFEPLSVHDERRRRSTTAPRDTPLRSSQEGGGGSREKMPPSALPAAGALRCSRGTATSSRARQSTYNERPGVLKTTTTAVPSPHTIARRTATTTVIANSLAPAGASPFPAALSRRRFPPPPSPPFTPPALGHHVGNEELPVHVRVGQRGPP